MDERLEQLIRWIAEHSERESAWLEPDPQWTVNSHSLLDKIVDLYKLNKRSVSKLVDTVTQGK